MSDETVLNEIKEVDAVLESENAIKWQTEIDLYRQFNTTLILEGNVNDKQLYINKEHDEKIILSLESYLDKYLRSVGYEIVIFFNQVEGFYSVCGDSKTKQENYNNFFDVIGKYKQKSKKEGGSDEATERTEEESSPAISFTPLGPAIIRSSLDTSAQYGESSKFPYCLDDIRIAMRNTIQPIAIVLTNVSRYISSPANLSDDDLYRYSQLYLASRERFVPRNKENVNKLANILFMIADKTNDIPAWFFVNNPNIRSINIPLPDMNIRKLYIDSFSDDFEVEPILKGCDLDVAKKQFVSLTDGLKICELDSLQKLMNDNDISFRDIVHGVTRFKHGVSSNPWEDPSLRNKLVSDGEGNNILQALTKRVKGQDKAVQAAANIISSAIIGLSGITHSSSSSKPRGIMFLAGPTGVGKTELAKAISNWVFGSDDHIVRFDMSEFAQDHTESRLFGAPPGYVGYEEGGELTGAIKRNPFSVILFDEIEKAHPRILDKFLQILEDGRLTDGKGETIFFSESLIIFTTNLGMYKETLVEEDGIRLMKKMPTVPYSASSCNIPEGEEKEEKYKEYKDKITNEIRSFFTNTIQRPEILNRIGDNIIVFDYISKDAARLIAESQLNKIVANLRNQKNIEFTLTSGAKETFFNELLTDDRLKEGGRGVGNTIDAVIVKPLSHYMVENNIFSDAIIEVIDIEDIHTKPKLIVK